MTTTQSVSDTLLVQLGDFVAAHMGLHFPPSRRRDLERGIGSAAQELGFDDVESCIRWLLSSQLNRSQIEGLARHLTVGETYFLREPKTFEILGNQVFPDLVRLRRGTEQRLRIWSAGCSSGEEPYSIAILLTQMIPNLADWNITILATDINPRCLTRAREGVYSEWSFRETPGWVTEKYFTKKANGRLEILPCIKKMVTFAYLNLAEDVYPSLCNGTNAMDVVFCRNVLMYFAPEQANKVVNKLYRSLVDGGWLIVSPSELSHATFSQFATVNFPCAILYRKDSQMLSTKGVAVRELSTEPELPHPLLTTTTAELDPSVASGTGLDLPLPPASEQAEQAVNRTNLYSEATALYAQGNCDRAAERLLALLSQNHQDAEAMALLTRVYADQGRLADAQVWCEKAIASNKMKADYYYLYAVILQEQGALEQARASLKRALYLDPDFVLAHFALANLTRRQGRSNESAKHFENTLVLLQAYRKEESLPGSEGITAGRLAEIVRLTANV